MPFHVPSLKLTQQDGYLESCSLAVISEAYVHKQGMFDLRTLASSGWSVLCLSAFCWFSGAELVLTAVQHIKRLSFIP